MEKALMMAVRVIVLGVVIWVFAKFEWRALIAGEPLPLSWALVFLLSYFLGELAMLSMVHSRKRESQRAQNSREDPKEKWMLPLAGFIVAVILLNIFYGRISFPGLSILPDPDHSLRKAAFGVLIGFVIGLFSHSRLRAEQLSNYKLLIKAGQARQARYQRVEEELTRAKQENLAEQERGRAVAENLWGAPAPENPLPKGSVPATGSRSRNT